MGLPAFPLIKSQILTYLPIADAKLGQENQESPFRRVRHLQADNLQAVNRDLSGRAAVHQRRR